MKEKIKKIIIKYNNLKVIGLKNIPKTGGLIIPNHPGQLFYDALCLMLAVLDKKIRFVAHYFDFKIPGLKRFLKYYKCLELDRDKEKINRNSRIIQALKNNELLCMWPEESYHNYKNNYTLFKFDSKFARYARISEKPVIPTAIIGVEEAFKHIHGPKFKNWPFHLPIGLWFPLKTKVIIEFGKPVYFKKKQTEEDFSRLIKERIYKMIKKYNPDLKSLNIEYLRVKNC